MASHIGIERERAWLWRKSCQIIPKPSTQIPKLYCCDLRSATYTIVLSVKEAFTCGNTSTPCKRKFSYNRGPVLSVGEDFWIQQPLKVEHFFKRLKNAEIVETQLSGDFPQTAAILCQNKILTKHKTQTRLS